MSIVPKEMVDFEALGDGLFDPNWTGGEPFDAIQIVVVEAWIDTAGALADGCPDLLDPTLCRPGPNNPQASEERELGAISFNTYFLTLEDPEE